VHVLRSGRQSGDRPIVTSEGVELPQEEIRVALVEDQHNTREALTTLIDGAPGYHMVGAYGSMEAALAVLPKERPDVLLADIGLPGMSGVEGVRLLKERLPDLQILMLTVYDDRGHVFEAICAGACGYLIKDTPPDRLLAAIHELHQGGAPLSPEIARRVVDVFQKTAPPPEPDQRLSPRETEVLRLFADGHSYKTAADALSVSTDTIRFHIRKIYDKLHVHSKSEAVLKAFRRGLLP
jgi:DNA-binding NarL/FixJ family response regulator